MGLFGAIDVTVGLDAAKLKLHFIVSGDTDLGDAGEFGERGAILVCRRG